MEAAMRPAWRASYHLLNLASRVVARVKPSVRCCSSTAAAAASDRRRRSSTSTSDRDSIRAIRLKKVEELRSKGHDPYAYTWDRSHTAKQLQDIYSHLENGAQHQEDLVSIAGRIVARRTFGKLAFFTIRDDSGTIQCPFLGRATDRVTTWISKCWEINVGARDAYISESIRCWQQAA